MRDHGVLGDRRAARIDQAEQPRALQIGANDRVDFLRHLAVALEVGHRNRKLVRSDAGDLDAKLRVGRDGEGEQREPEDARDDE